MVANVLEWGIT